MFESSDVQCKAPSATPLVRRLMATISALVNLFSHRDSSERMQSVLAVWCTLAPSEPLPSKLESDGSTAGTISLSIGKMRLLACPGT